MSKVQVWLPNEWLDEPWVGALKDLVNNLKASMPTELVHTRPPNTTDPVVSVPYHMATDAAKPIYRADDALFAHRVKLGILYTDLPGGSQGETLVMRRVDTTDVLYHRRMRRGLTPLMIATLMRVSGVTLFELERGRVSAGEPQAFYLRVVGNYVLYGIEYRPSQGRELVYTLGLVSMSVFQFLARDRNRLRLRQFLESLMRNPTNLDWREFSVLAAWEPGDSAPALAYAG